MQIRKTTSRWAIASAVAAMFAASLPGAFAQAPDTGSMSPAPTSTPPGPTSTTPDNSNTTAPSATVAPGDSSTAGTTDSGSTTGTTGSGSTDSSSTTGTTDSSSAGSTSGSMSSSSMSGSTPTNYKILSNRVFDYVDLSQARARGLSESQIASVVKIAKETGLPFRQVSAAVERGETFPALATEYGMKLSDVYDVEKEKQDVSDYTSLYESALALGKSGNAMSPMGSAPMSSAPMSTTPMTPSATPMTSPTMGSAATLDIVDTAMAAKNLTTLVKALQAAGLVETLKGAGPFTVFAPDDKAFSKLPAGALDSLLADPAKLKTILTYHVIPASIKASDALAMTSPTSPPTVEGGTLEVTKGRRGRLKVNDANVIKADIEASNGVIHIIDKVLMPPTDATTPAAPAPMDTMPAAPAPMTPAPAPDTATPPAAPAPDTTTPPVAPAPDTTTPTAPAPDTTTPPAAPAPDTTTPTPPAPAQ